MSRRTRSVLAAAVAVVAVSTSSALGADLIFEVKTTVDKPDAQIDGVCADVDGDCTLRAAIQEANAHPGEDIINIIGAKDQKFPLKVTGADEDAAATGDLDITSDVIIHGNEHAIIVGKKDRVLHIFPGVHVELDGVTVSGGSTLTKATVADPLTVEGAGILNLGDLLMSHCVVTGNKSQTNGGGIANRGTLTMGFTTIGKNKALGDGGGLYNGGLVTGMTTAGSVTFTKNAAKGHGGGIDNEHTVTLTNVTLSGNQAALEGGGLNNHDGATATLQSSTVKDNKTKDKTLAGGIANDGGSTATLTNVIVDTNKPFNCAGTLTSNGGNVEGTSTCGFGANDLANAGKLQMKGLKVDKTFGIVATHELKPTSPAIDAGVDAGCGPSDLDANGRPRRTDIPTVPDAHGSTCDAGATEFQPGT
jgi:predicted outer membrane repeat protein